jgi:hypothetical protein
MNWSQILANLVGVAGACAAAHKTLTASATTSWTDIGVGIALCVLANLVGLFQRPPTTPPALR